MLSSGGRGRALGERWLGELELCLLSRLCWDQSISGTASSAPWHKHHGASRGHDPLPAMLLVTVACVNVTMRPGID